ncbi:MAG: arsenate reductase family protein [Bacteroidota bacterium]
MAADTITIYQKPTCSTCRTVYKQLKEMGVDFDAVDYYSKPFSKSKLKSLLVKMGMKPRDLLRTKEIMYKELELGTKTFSEDELLDLMVKYPELIQRPIIEKGKKAILARPPERLKELF